VRLELAVGDGIAGADLALPEAQVSVVRSKNPRATREWEQIVGEALEEPIGAPRLREHDLRGKRIVVITDDWGRPTPAHRVLPAVLREVELAGARNADVTVMTGSGVHTPMSDEDLTRKVGTWVRERYRCVPHDAVDHEMQFMGRSPRGTPVWINRIAAEAHVRIAIGRIGPHITHGYEGGAKMITPAVSHWLTVLRNHSCNFSPFCEYGSYWPNPSRQDVDEIGAMVGLHYIVNFVINRFGEPFRGFAGHRLGAHRAGIAWGDREVWGAAMGHRPDVVIAAPGDARPHSFGASPLEMATIACRAGGTVILLNQARPAGRQLSALQREMAGWSFDRIFLEHERRDLDLPPRAISDRCKAIRGEYYARRPGMTRHVIVVGEPLAADAESRLGHHHAPTLQAAIDQAVDREGRDARVVVLPEAATTLPLERLHDEAGEEAPAGALAS
jgi:nickel-dependent lactate racemase